MTQDEFLNLKIGDHVSRSNSIYAQNLVVEEICEDEKSLNKWRDKGHSCARLCKFSGENEFHTWDVDWTKWNKV